MIAFQGKDRVGLYLTGELGVAAGGTIAGSLGGARMPREVKTIHWHIADAMPGIIVEHVGGVTTEGTGTIRAASASTLAYTAPGETEGTAVSISNGATALLLSGTSYVRVRRDSASDLSGTTTLTMRPALGSLLSFGNVTAGYADTGDNEYCAAMIHNHGADSVAVTVNLPALSSPVTTGTSQLTGTGGGFIICAANTLTSWPSKGYALIKQSGGTIREVVYYYTRTNNSLSILPGGRALLGTSASAGSNTDTITAISGLRIAIEAPDSEGLIQEIADRRTTPSGVSWTIEGTLNVGTLLPGQNYGLWLHRQVPGDMASTTAQDVRLNVNVAGDANRYLGRYRVASNDTVKYLTYLGVGEMPDFSLVDQEDATLPITLALTPPVSGQRDNNIVVRYQDAWGLRSYNTFPHVITIDSTGAQVGTAVSPPYDMSLEEIGSGYLRLRAFYGTGVDATDADKFRYYVTTNGVNPDPGVVTPVTVDMSIGQGLSSARVLDVTLGPYAYGTDVRVLVRAYLSSGPTASANLVPVTATISTTEPATPSQSGAGAGSLSLYEPGRGFTGIEYLNSPTNTVFWRYAPGVTELWAGAQLVFRALANGQDQVQLYMPSVWSLSESSVTGSGVAAPVEVSSATRLYLCVGGQRRVDINVSTLTISASGFDATGSIVSDAPAIGPAEAGTGVTRFQVYDQALGRWRSFLTVNDAGQFSARWITQRTS